MRRFRKSSSSSVEYFKGQHCYEHWYLDNQVYFITARCREKFAAFRMEDAKIVFFDRFNFYTQKYGFTPFVTSLLDNHYHTLGYLKVGENLGPMMQKIHGSVAKLVNDLLPERRPSFWVDAGHRIILTGAFGMSCNAGARFGYADAVQATWDLL